LPLAQVAVHIRGRLTAEGRPLAGRAVTLTASSGSGRPRFIRIVHSAADGSFGLHLRVVPAAEWRRPDTRRRLRTRFRFIIASFAGTAELRPARLRAGVTGP